MMSYQDCQPLYKYHEEELIALFVETLTGTTFEMTVSPYDTIMSIKNKIQRVEGIPVSQQHLLYNLHELEDSAALMDYSITNGSTIKLVISMRGGPISTVRRILPIDDVTLRELVDFNRDDFLDDLPPGCRMAVLVFREGDQLNMFRVLENTDGTYSPLSDSWSGSSIRNLFEEDDSDEGTKQRLEENNVTMEKMNHLKNKLEQLAIQRKSNKFPSKESEDVQASPSAVSSSVSSAVSNGSARTSSRSLSSSKRNNFLHLPPLRASEAEVSPEREPQDRVRKTRTAEFSRVPVLPDIAPSPPSIAVFDADVESVAVPRPKTSPDRLTGHQICEILSEAGRHRILGAHHCSASPLQSIPPVPNNDNNYETDWYNGGRLNTNKSLDKPSTSPSLYRSNNTITDKKLSRPTVVNPFNIFQGRNGSGSSVRSLFSSTKVGKLPIDNNALRRSVTPHTLVGKPNKLTVTSIQSLTRPSVEISPIEVRPKFIGMPAGNSNKPLPSLNSETFKPSVNIVNYNLSHSQSEQFTKKVFNSSPSKATDDTNAAKSECLSSLTGATSDNSVMKPVTKKNKKEHRSRCAKCNKRLTVTNTYTCRCGRIFCTNHRYSEAHECTYDYKSEGRRILEQNNPLISAPKLPKI